MPEKFQSRCGAPSQRPWTVPIARGVSRGRRTRRLPLPSPPSWSTFRLFRAATRISRTFAALTSASKMLPLLVQTKRDRLMRLAASTVPQALQHCEVSRRIDDDDPGSVPQNLYACVQLSERNGTSACKKPCHVRDARRDILKVTACTDGQGTNSARDITAPRPDVYVGPWQGRATRRAAARRRGRIRRPSRSGHNTIRSAQS
jgi:hypothetical protein